MGCIETPMSCPLFRLHIRLIVIWDVLKLGFFCISIRDYSINSNMGCIETRVLAKKYLIPSQINSNMGCIETEPRSIYYYEHLD